MMRTWGGRDRLEWDRGRMRGDGVGVTERLGILKVK